MDAELKPEEARRYYKVDGHTHLKKHDAEAGTRLLERSRKTGIDKIAIMALGEMRYATQNPAGLAAKSKHPDDIFLFAGLDYSHLSSNVEHGYTLSFAEQVERFIEMGCDGLKMLNGKPGFRRTSGVALNSPIYDGLFSALEESQFPLVWHINDPEEFWNSHPDPAPEWATRANWTYDDTFLSNEQIYEEAFGVLAEHPRLKAIFAHFCFLSADLPRAARLLDKYPQVCLDLTPGIEMYHNFSAQVDAAREFFITYQDRIVFGTDLVEDSPMGLTETVRKCLETDDTWHITTEPNLFWPDHRTTLRGLNLPEDVLRKIGGENFFRLATPEPRPLNEPAVRAEMERLAEAARQSGREEGAVQKGADAWLRDIFGE